MVPWLAWVDPFTITKIVAGFVRSVFLVADAQTRMPLYSTMTGETHKMP